MATPNNQSRGGNSNDRNALTKQDNRKKYCRFKKNGI